MRASLTTAALTLVTVVAVAVLLQGNAAAADRAGAARNLEPAPSGPVAAAAPSAAQPQVEVKAATPSAPVKRRPRLVEKKPPEKKLVAAKPPAPEPKAQRFKIAIGPKGYEPGVIRAAAGQPIVLSVGRGEGCAAGFLIPKLGVEKDNSTGPATVRLGRVSPGKYQFSCGMGMVTGTLLVK